jgi:cytochrome d ubiquinol oxidase subunit I
MGTLFLSRLQFAFTAGFHFIFPPLTIGLAWYIFLLAARWVRSGRAADEAAAIFWTRIFAVSFAIGVATGIPLEFQFGTNWSAYAKYVGDIFGAPLAAEVIFAFFLESSFLAVLVFGWRRFSPRTIRFAALMVAAGATLSAFWILAANSWMQTPAGFVHAGERVELADFAAALFNPSTFPRFFHTIIASLATAAFFVLAVGAWYMLRGVHREFAAETVRFAMWAALLLSLAQIGIGHWHAVQVAHTQPEKLAAVEGLFETQRRAPALVFGIPDEEAGTVRAEARIPGLLSLLAFGDPDAEVKGLDAFPREEWPPLLLTFLTFHAMVGLGFLFVAAPALGIFLMRKGRLEASRWFLRLAVCMAPLPFLANELGWITAEVGRQPWAVYRLLKTADGVTPGLPAWQVLASLIMFAALYAVLFVLWLMFLRDIIRAGPKTPAVGGTADSGSEASA